MINSEDFKTPEGKVDYAAYKAARIANGEECSRCGAFISFTRGYSQLCYDCRHLDTDVGETSHDNLIRCPFCRCQNDVYDGGYDFRYEGTHSVQCGDCNKYFDVEVEISYCYTSPPLEPPDGEEKSEE